MGPFVKTIKHAVCLECDFRNGTRFRNGVMTKGPFVFDHTTKNGRTEGPIGKPTSRNLHQPARRLPSGSRARRPADGGLPAGRPLTPHSAPPPLSSTAVIGNHPASPPL